MKYRIGLRCRCANHERQKRNERNQVCDHLVAGLLLHQLRTTGREGDQRRESKGCLACLKMIAARRMILQDQSAALV